MPMVPMVPIVPIPMVPIPTNDMVDFAKIYATIYKFKKESSAYIRYLKIGNFLKLTPLEPAAGYLLRIYFVQKSKIVKCPEFYSKAIGF